MTIDDEATVEGAVLERLEEYILDLKEDDFFLTRVARDIDSDLTTEVEAVIQKVLTKVSNEIAELSW